MDIKWNELTPACYAITNVNGVDLGTSRLMVRQNIEKGTNINKGAEALPKAFRPDWAALCDPDMSDAEGTYDNGEFNVWGRIMQARQFDMAPLWNSGDYQGMIDLMNKTADPGLIDGEKPDD